MNFERIVRMAFIGLVLFAATLGPLCLPPAHAEEVVRTPGNKFYTPKPLFPPVTVVRYALTELGHGRWFIPASDTLSLAGKLTELESKTSERCTPIAQQDHMVRVNGSGDDVFVNNFGQSDISRQAIDGWLVQCEIKCACTPLLAEKPPAPENK